MLCSRHAICACSLADPKDIIFHAAALEANWVSCPSRKTPTLGCREKFPCNTHKHNETSHVPLFKRLIMLPSSKCQLIPTYGLSRHSHEDRDTVRRLDSFSIRWRCCLEIMSIFVLVPVRISATRDRSVILLRFRGHFREAESHSVRSRARRFGSFGDDLGLQSSC